MSNCYDMGGNFYENRLCSSLSETECPAPPVTGSCCHPKISYVNEEGVFPVQCLNALSESKCNLLQGKWSQSTSCSDLSETQCGSWGACCYYDGTIERCSSMLEDDCFAVSGTWTKDEICANVECAPVESGGCCLTTKQSNGLITPVNCVDDRQEFQCLSLGGTWMKDKLCGDMTETECPPLTQIKGACCIKTSDGQTQSASCKNDMTAVNCATLGGFFHASQQCNALSSEVCPVPEPTGSCCHPKVSYVNESGVFPVRCLDALTEYKCKLLQGTWNQAYDCSGLGDSCPEYGACCHETGCVNWLDENDCQKNFRGNFFGGQKCDALSREQCSSLSCMQIDPSSYGPCTNLLGFGFSGFDCVEVRGCKCDSNVDPTCSHIFSSYDECVRECG
jgi:hypothetical protein